MKHCFAVFGGIAPPVSASDATTNLRLPWLSVVYIQPSLLLRAFPLSRECIDKADAYEYIHRRALSVSFQTGISPVCLFVVSKSILRFSSPLRMARLLFHVYLLYVALFFNEILCFGNVIVRDFDPDKTMLPGRRLRAAKRSHELGPRDVKDCLKYEHSLHYLDGKQNRSSPVHLTDTWP